MKLKKILTVGLLSFSCCLVGAVKFDALASTKSISTKLSTKEKKVYLKFETYCSNVCRKFRVDDVAADDNEKQYEEKFGKKFDEIPEIDKCRWWKECCDKKNVGNCRVISAACKLELDKLKIKNHLILLNWDKSTEQHNAVMYEKAGRWYVMDLMKFLDYTDPNKREYKKPQGEEFISYITNTRAFLGGEPNYINGVTVLNSELKEGQLSDDVIKCDVRTFLSEEYPSAVEQFKQLEEHRFFRYAISKETINELKRRCAEEAIVDGLRYTKDGKVYDSDGDLVMVI